MAARAKPSILVVGRGRVGRSLALAWRHAGYPVRMAAHDAPHFHHADVAVLSVIDPAIRATAEHWSTRLPPGALVLHTAGAVTLEALEPARLAGMRVGSLHPLIAIPGPRTDVRGGFCAVDGADRRALRLLAIDAGMHPMPAAPDDRARYHLGAVLASNFQAPLLEAATAQLVSAGVDANAARRGLAQLAHTAIDGWLARGGPMGLTGPVARGDVATVEKHLSALPAGPDRALYLALSRAALELASKREPVPSGLAELARLLKRG